MQDTDRTLADLSTARTRGDMDAVMRCFERHRQPLRRMVEFRLDPRLRRRLDPSDVLQESYIEVLEGLDRFLDEPQVPFHVWLRILTGRKLLELQRRHFAGKRDVTREVSVHDRTFPATSSVALVESLAGSERSPSSIAARLEWREVLHEALEAIDPLDREILTLRYFEGLSNRDAAATLGLNESTASTRYVRALRSMRGVLARLTGGEAG